MSAPAELCARRLESLMSEGFLFGVATAAYQIEGAFDEDGRTDSIWDVFCQQPGRIRNGDTGELACDHYHRWREDVDLLKTMGVDAYRFSLSWSRILPDGDGGPNQRGLDFYCRLVDRLRESGIRPMVTLYHWDLPQYLQERGGWQQRETAYRFAEFTQVVARAFGESVDFYTTINEPWCVAFMGHRYGIHAPGIQDEAAPFLVAHHLLLAHGLSVQNLREQAPHADVGIVLNGGPVQPATSSPEDRRAALDAEAEQNDLFAGPLFEGSYPSALAGKVEPAVQAGDLSIIKAPCDYLGWNYYTRSLVRSTREGGFETVPAPDRPVTAPGWEIYPQGLRELLVGLNSRYELPPMYITENGAAFMDTLENGENGTVNDRERLAYLRDHLDVLAELVREGFDVRGYVCWSFLDNFEWAEGYAMRYGLVRVDYGTQKRTIKASGKAFAALLDERNRLRKPGNENPAPKPDTKTRQ